MALRKTCSLSYITVDTAAERALALGRGAKLDIKQAYKMVPVHCCLCYFGFLRVGEITVPTEAAYDPTENI